jgi:hypothetical protein
MKKHSQLALTISLVVLINPASAHDKSTSIGNSSQNTVATDVYLIACGSDETGVSDKLEVRIKTKTPKNTLSIPNYAHLSIQIQKDGTDAYSAVETDPINGDTNYSTSLSLAEGVGGYIVTVSKPATTPASCDNGARYLAPPNKTYAYTMQYHCKGPGGIHTETVLSQRLNQ